MSDISLDDNNLQIEGEKMGSMQVKISIIIPIYNAEKFINQTLYSCVKQSLKDIEIICVNDCSTDKTAEMLEDYAKKDNRIRCIHHEINLGEGLARKSGILASKGKYIMFLDADDSLRSDACRHLYREMETEKVDMIQFGTAVSASDTVSEPELDGLYKILTPYAGRIISENQAGLVPHCFEQHQFAFSIWNKIYRADIVRQAVSYYREERFDLGADLYLFFLIAFFSRSYASVNKEYYYYNFGAGITGGKALTDKMFRNKAKINKIVQNLAEFCEKNDPLGYSDAAIEDLKKIYVSAIVYALVFQGGELDKNEAMKCILEYYDSADVLSEFLTYYRNFEDARKKELIDLWINSPLATSDTSEVKTIGTFYYRLADGGVERVTSLLMNIWCELGYQVVLFTEEVPSQQDYQYPDSVVRVVVPKIKDSSVAGYLERVKFWQNMIEHYNVDVMVYHAWVFDEIAADILSIKSTNIPMIIHTHGLFAHGVSSFDARYAYHTMNITRLFRMVDAVITLTETDYNWWSMFHPHVYRTNNPPTFKLEDIKTAPLESGSLLYVGRIHPDKKVEDCIKILKEVVDAGCETKLHIVGGTDYKEYYESLQRLVKCLKLKDHVFFHGYQTDVRNFYQNATINLLTSVAEGTPMTLIEAMASGVPSVVYNLLNVDIIQKEKGIKVVSQGDVKGAAKEVVALLTDKEYLKSEGKAARESVEEMFCSSIPDFWKKLFENLECDQPLGENQLSYDKIRNAVTIMVNNYLSGVEKRTSSATGIENSVKLPMIQSWRKRTPTGLDPYDGSLFLGDRVLALYQNGMIGIKYIVHFFFAWAKVKVKVVLRRLHLKK